MTDLEQNLGLLAPAGILALEEVTEELLLQVNPVVRVKMRPVLDPVHFEPFLLRGGAHEALEIATRMQALAAPIGAREQRRLDLGPVRHARLPEVVGIELAR